MEAEYLAERRRRRLVVILGLLLAVAAAAATYYVVTRPVAAPVEVPQRSIVVAATNIAARTVISSDMLRTLTVPDDPAFDAVLADPAQAVGSLSAIDIAAGDPITSSMFASGTGAGLPILGPLETVSPDSPIWRAVSVLVPPDRAVAGMIGPSDHVDLFVTLSPQLFDPSGGVPIASPFVIRDPSGGDVLTGGLYADQTTKLVWENLEVLAVDPNKSMYVLKVSERQAEEIAHVQSIKADFTLALRPAPDARDVDRTDFGQTTNKMIEEYGFEIPGLILITGPAASPGSSPVPTATATAGPPESPTPTP
jgi:Flp pilus assembly protein CpaB